MTKKRYLVTGGLGFIGAPLVCRLLEKGYEVRVLDNQSRGRQERLGNALNRVEIIQGDIRNADVVRKALHHCNSVCHLAYINGTENFYKKPVDVLEIAVKGMTNVLDGCVQENVEELILASSSEVYQTPSKIPTDESAGLSIPDPFNPRYSYGGGKILNELMAIHYGKKYFRRALIFRPHNVFGPDMGWEHVIPQFIQRMSDLKASSKGGEIPFEIQGTGNETRAFIYIEDFVDGLLRVIEKGEHLNIYHIGTMEEIKIKDVAHQIADCLRVNIKIVPGAPAQGGTLRRCPEIKKLKALGFSPRFKLKDGLIPTIDWYLTHKSPVKQ